MIFRRTENHGSAQLFLYSMNQNGEKSSVNLILDGASWMLYFIYMTLDDQIADLTRKGSGAAMRIARPLAVLIAVSSVLAGVYTGHLAFYGVALVFALLAFAIWQTSPHIHNAVRGLREGLKQNGTVEISVHQWRDAESNSYDSYDGLILMDNQPVWQMEFVTPQNWQPVEGRYSAQLAFIRGVEWPVVILTSDGLLYPRFKPKRAVTAPS